MGRPVMDETRVGERQLAYYALLHQITASLHRSLDFDEILETAVTGLLRELSLTRCSVWFPESNGELMIRRAAGQVSGGPLAGPVWLMAWDALADRRIVTADDVQSYGLAGLSDAQPGNLGQVMAEAAMVAPIVLEAELKGLLLLEAAHPRAWSPLEIQLIEAVTDQLTVALVHSRMLESLRQLDAMKTEFVSIASHELRTPITVIRGYAAVLLRHGDALDSAERTEYIHMIDQRAEHLSRLVEDILDVSRLEGGKLSLQVAPFEVASILQKVFQALSVKYHRPFNLDYRSFSARRTLLADAARFEQVLLNLLDNAIKYSPPEGRIDLRIGDTASGIRVTVTNPGDKLESQEVSRLSGKFVRLDRHRALGGTGLGLYICRRLVELMGGDLELTPLPQGGLKASFELPWGDTETTER